MLAPAAIERARTNHPLIASGGQCEASDAYLGSPALSAPFTAPLAEPPTQAAKLRFAQGPLAAVRAFAQDEASRAGLSDGRLSDLVLAVNEIATNSIRHGGGEGVLRIWQEDARLICEIRDAGRFDNPLADRMLPPAHAPGGRGLYTANQVCDLVQIRSVAEGTIVRLHLACP